MTVRPECDSLRSSGPSSVTAPRLLILGGGALLTELYLPALIRLRWESGVVVVDNSSRAIKSLRESFPNIRAVEADYQELMSDASLPSKFDGVVVALPNAYHEDAVTRCLDAGLHVLCEKPLALDARTCTRLHSISQRSRGSLSVAMVRRTIPYVIAIREALLAGLIGEVVEVDIAHGGKFTWPTDSGAYFRRENGGLLVNMGVHYLDLIEDWVGSLQPVEYRDDWGGGAEANVRYWLRTERGARVCVTLSLTHQLHNRIFVKGSRGEIQASVEKFDSCTWRSFESALEGTIQPFSPFRDKNWPLDFVSSFMEQFWEFNDVIRGARPPRVSGAHAARTHQLIDWAYAHRRPWYAAHSDMKARPALAPARAIVTGGSGFLGEKLVGRLCDLNFRDVCIPLRWFRSGAGVCRFPVQRVITNLLDPQGVTNAIRGAKYVFHLAYGNSGKEAQRITIEGTRNVVEAAIKERAEVVVIVSTASVFGHPERSDPVDESFPYRPANGSLREYSQAKTAAEKYCLVRAQSSDSTRIVVLNPSAIYGPGSVMFAEFPVRSARAGVFCWVENGRGKLNYTYVENVVDAIISAAGHKGAHGQRFIINDGVCSFREFLTPLLGELAADLPSYRLDELASLQREARPRVRDLLGALLSDDVMRVINEMPVLSTAKRLLERKAGGLYQAIQTNRKTILQNGSMPRANRPPLWLADFYGPIDIEYSAARAKEALGWSPIVTLEQGQQASVEWLRQIGLLSS